MTITTVAILPPAVREYYDRLLLMTAYPQLIHTKFAQKRILPAKNGDTIVFRRYSRLATVPIPLVDGITPPGAPLSVNDIKAQVQFYGNYVTITNQVELTVEDRILNETTQLIAQNMAQTIDEITRDVLASTSTVLQCANGTNGQTPTNITSQDVAAVTKLLMGNNALMISKVVPGANLFATTPVRQAYWGLMSTDLLDDLEQCSNFANVANYAGQGSVLDGEWGQTGNVRWLLTSIGSVSSATPAVYNNFVVGEEAYGVIHLQAETGDFYVKPLGSAGSADPLDQRGTVGWQHPFCARILTDTFMCNLMATHS